MASVANISKVKQIYCNMSYEKIEEDFSILRTWLEDNGYFSVTEAKKNIDVSIFEKPLYVDRALFNNFNCETLSSTNLKEWFQMNKNKRASLFNRVVDEIEKHSNLICQMEMKTNEILSRDTTNESIPILIDYFRYYASMFIDEIFVHLPSLEFSNICCIHVGCAFPIGILGMEIATALAAGTALLVHVQSSALYPNIHLLQYIMDISGFPKNVLQINIGDKKDCRLIPAMILDVNPSIDKEHLITNKALYRSKSSMIVFEDSDIVSATECATRATFSSRGMFPWSLKYVYVQETIFNDFIHKLKSLFGKLHISKTGADKNCDISLPSNITIDDILIIGSMNASHHSLSLHILPFRTVNEAVALVNNNSMGMAVSLWAENISLVYEVTPKLKVGIIWVNDYGRVRPAYPFTPYKKFGKGTFGGREGLIGYMHDSVKKKITEEKCIVGCDSFLFYGGNFKMAEKSCDNFLPNSKIIQTCYETARKASDNWKQMAVSNRIKTLRTFADLVMSSSSIKKENENFPRLLQEYIYKYTNVFGSFNASIHFASPLVQVVQEPLGVVTTTWTPNNITDIKIIAAALCYGNALIILNYSDNPKLLFELCKIVKSLGSIQGMINIIFKHSLETNQILQRHPDIDLFLNNEVDEDLILPTLTRKKCTWISTGQSF